MASSGVPAAEKTTPVRGIIVSRGLDCLLSSFCPLFVPTERSVDMANEKREIETSNAAIPAYESIGALVDTPFEYQYTRNTFRPSLYN